MGLMYNADIHRSIANLCCGDIQIAYSVDMRYDKPFMIRFSEQEHAMLDDLLRKEDKIVSKAELIRRLIQRAHEGQHDSAAALLRDAYWKLAGFMGGAHASRAVDKLRERIRAYVGDVEDVDAQ